MSHKSLVEGEIPNLLTVAASGSNNRVVFLDRKLTNSQARVNTEVKQILTNILKESLIVVYHEFFYRVDFGPDVKPNLHIISNDLVCACTQERDCPAVVAVKVYLRDGGEPAKNPHPGYFPAVPHVCPVCGARACYEPRLSSHHRGIGWQCSKSGAAHYWQHQGNLPRLVCTT